MNVVGIVGIHEEHRIIPLSCAVALAQGSWHGSKGDFRAWYGRGKRQQRHNPISQNKRWEIQIHAHIVILRVVRTPNEVISQKYVPVWPFHLRSCFRDAKTSKALIFSLFYNLKMDKLCCVSAYQHNNHSRLKTSQLGLSLTLRCLS